MINAGPTREPLDPVRFISNYSSGKMGVALADAAAELGARVDLVLGPVFISPKNINVNVINVTTSESMSAECISRFHCCDIAILAAAVADFTPVVVSGEKIKKNDADLIIRFKPTTDIAHTLGLNKKKSQVVVGFALETENGIENAKAKLLKKNFDFIVLNSPKEEGAGFGHDTNKITIIDRFNNIDRFELKSKEEVAKDILKKIISVYKYS